MKACGEAEEERWKREREESEIMQMLASDEKHEQGKAQPLAYEFERAVEAKRKDMVDSSRSSSNSSSCNNTVESRNRRMGTTTSDDESVPFRYG